MQTGNHLGSDVAGQSTPRARPQPYPLLSRLLAPRGCDDVDLLRSAVSGKTVLVTGSSFGIGEALAVRLGAAGARVLLAARSVEQLETVKNTIQAAGGAAFVYPLDLMVSAQIDSAAEQILSEHQRLDIVIHNAGKSIRRSLLDALDRPHDFERCMGINYLGPVRLQLALLPTMIKCGAGHLINVSSVSVKLPPTARWAAYFASKAAFDIWLRSAAPELKPNGIDCTSAYFGLVHTRMSAPTEAYASLPGQTAEQAASVLCRAIISRPRSLAPWWLGPAHWLSAPLEPATEWVQTWLSRREQNKP